MRAEFDEANPWWSMDRDLAFNNPPPDPQKAQMLASANFSSEINPRQNLDLL